MLLYSLEVGFMHRSRIQELLLLTKYDLSTALNEGINETALDMRGSH